MKITFLGTRGYIDARTKLHHNHASALLSYKKTRLILDVGLDWKNKINDVSADAILITHAHPDHAFGLANGAPCPVYATRQSWKALKKYPVKEKHIVRPLKSFRIGSFFITAFSVVHSIRAPAVSYRIVAGKSTIFYSGDLVYIKDREKALKNISLYIGDGAAIKRSIIRKRDDTLIGHAAIQTQLTWCKKAGITRAIFTHCGSEIVEAHPKTVAAKVKELGKIRGVKAEIAHDGMTVTLR